MKKESPFIFISTENKSREMGTIVMRPSDGRLATINVLTTGDPQPCINQHLHILSDDKMETGDWCFDLETNTPMPFVYSMNGNKRLNKIIASTDQRQNGVPSISQSDIEYIVSLYNGKDKEVDIDKLSEKSYENELKYKKMSSRYPYKIGFRNGYNQCLQDKADKIEKLENWITDEIKKAEEDNEDPMGLDKIILYSTVKAKIQSLAKEQPKSNTVMVVYMMNVMKQTKPVLQDGYILIMRS